MTKDIILVYSKFENESFVKVDDIVIKTCFGYSMLEMEDWEMIKLLLYIY